jgi:hypothetical protein
MLRNEKSGLCLNVMGGLTATNGAAVAQWPCDVNDPNQKWEIVPAGATGYYVYENAATDMCMTVSGYSASDRGKVEGWDADATCDLQTNHSYWWMAGPLGSPPF